VKNPKSFVIALVVAIIATFAQCRYVHTREQALLYDSEPLRTLIAKRDIPPHVRVDETMVEAIAVPRKWQQPKALGSADETLGQITSAPIFKGEQIVASKLVTVDDAGLAFYVPKGYRAISLAVDVYNAVGGHIRPGNKVDVLGTFDFGQGEKSDLRTVTIMQDAWVLSVVDDIGAITARDVRQAPPEGQPVVEESSPPSERLGQQATISLAVRPQEAQKLILAQELGRLAVSLRSLWEGEGAVGLEPTTVQSALGIPEQVRFRSRPAYRVLDGGL
jgi:pilus assembly protein CpaB